VAEAVGSAVGVVQALNISANTITTDAIENSFERFMLFSLLVIVIAA
jgi:hypothetical protein